MKNVYYLNLTPKTVTCCIHGIYNIDKTCMYRIVNITLQIEKNKIGYM